MVIRLTRQPDGSVIMRCDRADGTATWQRQNGQLASVFPFHDITHYAVETELGFRAGFFGLVADGWDIRDTGGKGARGPLPAETLTVEHIVGLFDVQRSLGVEWTADDVNDHARTYVSTRDEGLEVRELNNEEIVRVRSRIRELTERWNALAPNETLELQFDMGTG
jgi:hypothetical protein